MERYSLGKARGEAEKMAQRLKSGEASNYSEAEQKISEETLETILTPEVVEKIMEKVQDIDEIGTAYHSLDAGLIGTPTKELPEEKLSSVLQSGIVGVTNKSRKISNEERKGKSAKENWLGFIKERERPNVFFSIVGRLAGENSGDKTTMGANYIMFNPGIKHDDMQYSDVIAIIFDLSPFKEVISDKRVGLPIPRFSYSNWSHSLSLNATSSLDYGFRLSSRVPPRFFKGVVIDIGEDKYRNKESYHLRLQNRLQEVIDDMFEVDKEKPEYLLPIYDIDGNLLWPKQMLHEEVKELVKKKKAEGK